LSTQLAHLDSLDAYIAACDGEIITALRLEADSAAQAATTTADPGVSPPSYLEAVQLLDTIPGVNQRLGEIILAEIGADMRRFPSARHLASWVGICPGNHQSAGKHLSGKTRQGDRWLRQALIEAAHGAMRTKQTYLSAQGRRLGQRRGQRRAVVAVGQSILIIAYHVLSRKQPYQDLGSNYFDERDRTLVARQSIRRLEQLGFKVTVESPSQVA
jgi:transposase